MIGSRVTLENPGLPGRALIWCLVFCPLSVITEAAILKKHNLFEDNMALPSESVSSLTDLKTSMGSNQASPARRASAILPGVPGDEAPSHEVFQEPEEKQPQPGAPGSLAREESASISGSSPPSGEDGQVSVSGVDNSAGNPLTADNSAGPLSSHLSEAEAGEAPKDEEAAHKRPESSAVPGSLRELKELLTVTVFVESAPEIGSDTLNGTPVPREDKKEEEEEEENKVHPEASGPAAIQQDSCEESEVREREVHPMPLEAEAPGVSVGTPPEGRGPTSQSTGEGLTENTSCLGPIEEPCEAPGPAEEVLLATVSTQDSTEAGGEAVHSVTVTPQEDATLSSNPICPVESNEGPQVSGDQEVLGGSDSPALAMDTEQINDAHVYECHWEVEDAPSADIVDAHDCDVGSPGEW